MTAKVNKLDIALLLLRLAAGGIFIFEGYLKLFVVDRVRLIEYFASLGLPYPQISVLVVSFLEFLGGILLVLGASTRIVAALFAVEMLVATFVANLPPGFNAATEVTILLLVISTVLVIMEGGRWTVDQLIKTFKHENTKTR